MSETTVGIDVITAEFMLDLPEGTKILSAAVSNDKLLLTLETAEDFPEGSTLVYESDDYGNVALTGAN
jgi:hypothetical protein